MAKSRKMIGMLLLVVSIIAGYTFWLSQRPVEITAIYGKGEFSDVLVKNFPFTDRGKITWWLENKAMLKEKYKIPSPAKDAFFSITFWLFDGDYTEEGKYDKLCFDEIKKKEKCIDKNPVFSVSNSKNRGTILTVHDGKYHVEKNGTIVKIKGE